MSLGASNRWLAVVIVSSVGCLPAEAPGDSDETGDPTGSGEFVSVIDHQQWTPIDATADPLAEHRPTAVDCGLGGWYLENASEEDESLEIDTNLCNYLALGQPSRAAITEGHAVRLGLYYFNLTAPEPALAHIAMLVDNELLWEREIEIPGDAQVLDLEFESPLSAPLGAEVVFHLHNHGQNTWVLRYLLAEQ